MNVIKIKLDFDLADMWFIMSIICTYFSVSMHLEGMRNTWAEIVRGEVYTFNPFTVAIKDGYLILTNKNEVSPETHLTLDLIELTIKHDIERYEINLLDQWEGSQP